MVYNFTVRRHTPIIHVQLEDPTWKPVYGEIEFECGHWGVFENAIDMAHIHYLHSDSFGNKVTAVQGSSWPALAAASRHAGAAP